MDIEIKLPPINKQKEIEDKLLLLDSIKRLIATFEGDKNPKIPKSWLKFDEGYEPPSVDELKETFKPLTGSQVANIVGVNSRTVRRWTGGEREIPYASWRLFLISMGKIVEKPFLFIEG